MKTKEIFYTNKVGVFRGIIGMKHLRASPMEDPYLTRTTLC